MINPFGNLAESIKELAVLSAHFGRRRVRVKLDLLDLVSDPDPFGADGHPVVVDAAQGRFVAASWEKVELEWARAQRRKH